MEDNKINSFLVRKVLNHVLQTYKTKSDSSEETSNSLREALTSLSPFSPSEQDKMAINNILLQNQASDLACKAAWALYKDYVVNEARQLKDRSAAV